MSHSGRYAKKRRGLERALPALARRLRRVRQARPHVPILAIGIILLGIGVSMLALTPSSPFSVVSSDDDQAAGSPPERSSNALGPTPTTAPTSTAPTSTAPTSTAPTSTTTTDPGPDSSVLVAEVSAEPADLVVQVVPAVRDLQVDIDGQRYSSDASGRIEAPMRGADAEVVVIGYQVTPAVQQVSFTGWEDGSTSSTRTVSTDGTDREIDLGVEVRYQVAIDGEAAPDAAAVTLDDTGGTSDFEAERGESIWIPAMAAVPTDGDRLAVRTFTYGVTVDGEPVDSVPYRPTPEGLLVLP